MSTLSASFVEIYLRLCAISEERDKDLCGLLSLSR